MVDFEHEQKIDTEQLKEAIDQHKVKVVEVMPAKMYEKEHIETAINIPLTELKELAPKLLKKDENIVVYCSDIDCIASPAAARMLREMGHNKVLDYEEGKIAWKKAGLPMERGKLEED